MNPSSDLQLAWNESTVLQIALGFAQPGSLFSNKEAYSESGDPVVTALDTRTIVNMFDPITNVACFYLTNKDGILSYATVRLLNGLCCVLFTKDSGIHQVLQSTLLEVVPLEGVLYRFSRVLLRQTSLHQLMFFFKLAILNGETPMSLGQHAR